jgi:hypothetical protein
MTHSLKWVRIKEGATPFLSRKEGPSLPFRLRPYKVKKSSKMSEKRQILRKTPKVGKKMPKIGSKGSTERFLSVFRQ